MDGIDLGPEADSEKGQRLIKLGQQSLQELHNYMAALLDKYAKQPGPGMLSAMVNSSEERLSQGELLSNAQLLLFAGHEQRGTTLVLVTHDPALAVRCDRIVQLRSGRIEIVHAAVEANP